MRFAMTVGLVGILAAPAVAQTEQWSQPSKTERWSEAPAPPAPSSTPPAGETGLWSSPTYTDRVDPRKMDEPEVLASPGPIEQALVGSWDIRVPGGIWYSSDGSRIYRNYTPGAPINRLTVAADGSYRWGEHSGRLLEVNPWFAQPGERYFAVQFSPENRYIARYDASSEKLNLFFWGVGGHAATGTRR